MTQYIVYVPVKNPVRQTQPQQRIEVDAVSSEQAISLGESRLKNDGFIIDDGRRDLVFAVEPGANEHYPIDIDIFAIEGLGDLPTEDAGYCRSYAAKDQHGGKTYVDWEAEIATPALEAVGFTLTWCWCNGEADSFGPLSRKTYAVKDGKHYVISYG